MHIHHITCIQNSKVILQDFSLYLNTHKITCLMGASGVGKSTLCHILARLIEPKTISRSPIDYSVGYVFQEPRLLAHLTVTQNILWGLSSHSKITETKVTQLLSASQLLQVRDYYPHQLSGGMQQRVALLRAIITKPDLLLLDEALRGLDQTLKMEIIHLILDLHHASPMTTLFVSHSLEECLAIGHRLLIVQGAPLTIVGDFMITNNKLSSHDAKRVKNLL